MNSAPQPTTGAAILDAHAHKDQLRFLTCGSVDDGKSTLIGRLLADTHRVYDDHLAEALRASARHGTTGGDLDHALLLDGLKAEREQGITIDVAYRYFSTPRRSFIVADCPGHVQYTRNMATGASTCDLAVLLVDAQAGIVEQTRRHAIICGILGIRHLALAINKMDLVDWSEARFAQIRDAFTACATRLGITDLYAIPLSATQGINVAGTAGAPPWWRGGSLLHHLETVHIASDRNLIDFRFPIQLVLRPDPAFRGYAGTIASGVVRPGDAVVALPSGRRSRITSVLGPGGDVGQAFAPMAVTLTLADDLDCARGDWLVHPGNRPRSTTTCEALVLWLRDAPLRPGARWLVQHATRTVAGAVEAVRYAIDIADLRQRQAEALPCNGIGRVAWRLAQPIFLDPYDRNRATGGFLIIDPATQQTVGAGMLLDRNGDPGPPQAVGAAERQGRLGHAPALIRTTSDQLSIEERRQFDAGRVAVVVARNDPHAADRIQALMAAGLVVVTDTEE